MAAVVTLILVGAALLLLETVLPGLIAGTIGFLCLVGAVVAGYVEFGPAGGNYLLAGLGSLLIIGALVWVKYFPKSRLARPFILERTIGNLGVEKPELLHQTGTALTNLRPSGTAIINGKRIDVVTEGGMIERGTPVKVIAIEGLRVVVRALQPEPQPNPTHT